MRIQGYLLDFNLLLAVLQLASTLTACQLNLAKKVEDGIRLNRTQKIYSQSGKG
jgi:hypothetical protein